MLMRWRDTLHMAYKGVTVNVSRALLTMLGLIIGVAAVVLMSSIGKSMEKLIVGQIDSLGTQTMVIFPGSAEGSAGQLTSGFDSITFDDIDEIKKLSSVTHVAPVILLPGSAQYGNEKTSPQVLGVNQELFFNADIKVSEGRGIEENDVEGAKAVALLGPDVVDDLFGQMDPIGKRIKIGNNHFTVIGVTKSLGTVFFQNVDKRIYIPLSFAKQATGQKYVTFANMQATDSFDQAVSDIKYLLRRRHGIKNPLDEQKKDDFIVRTSAEAGKILGSISLGLTMFITTIAAVSLLVGGIGIMNIMLVSVTERTQEIGLRKALGARRKDILMQFLIETVVLTIFGGTIGVLGGILVAFLGALITQEFLASYTFAVSVGSIIAAFFMAAATGLVFGITPARRAAALHPIDALRYE